MERDFDHKRGSIYGNLNNEWDVYLEYINHSCETFF